MTDALLVEVFTEELPPKALPRLAAAFANGVFDGLVRLQLTQRDPRWIRGFATPRRLGVLVPGVSRNAADRREEKKLMPAKVAFDGNGKPTTALLRRLDKEGESPESVEKLERRNDAGTEQVFLSRIIPGAELGPALQQVLEQAIAALPIPKVMRYQTEGEDVEFIRPAHGLVALYGSEIVPVKVLQLEAGRVTHGHRFQGAQNITLAHAEEYESKLRKEGGVIASFDERREEIRRQLISQASSLTADLRLDERAELLDEVTALVEFPTVYVGEFEREFLAVPQECLILTMQQHQKYFPLFDRNGRLLNRFLIVSNMRLDDPANIVQGNQRVIRPRLADARFFFETDRKTRLADRVPQLAGIVYHNKLGSQLERIERLRKLARTIAERTGTDTALADRAALLCKADLLTGMVGEFPELQGIMGRYYALHDGEDPRVADAIEAHYRPRFSGDTLPATGTATAVALADKLDALVGMFGIGLAPTGEKDPFGLRRQAMGIIRTLVEHGLPLDLIELLNAARELLPSKLLTSSVVDEVYLFIVDRLRSYLREREFQPDEIEAVLSQVPSRIDLVLPRLKAVQDFKKLPEAEALASANKRIQNILRKSEIAGDMIQPNLFQEAEEIDLYELMVKLDGRVEPLVESGNYDEALKALATLRRPVDTFFDRVLVNADDMRIRANRHGLLLHLSALMNQVADISKLVRGEA